MASPSCPTTLHANTTACFHSCGGGEELDFHKFISWVAVGRNTSSRVTSRERRLCPLLRCTQDFPDHASMLQHLVTCDELPHGEYWCFECSKVEHYIPPRPPESDSRRPSRKPSKIRKFGTACLKALRQTSLRLATRDSRTRDLNGSNFVVGEISDDGTHGPWPINCSSAFANSNVVYELEGDLAQPPAELDTSGEILGFISGVQFLDTMHNIAQTRPSESQSQESLDRDLSPLDFSNASTFEFLEHKRVDRVAQRGLLRRSNAIRIPRPSSDRARTPVSTPEQPQISLSPRIEHAAPDQDQTKSRPRKRSRPKRTTGGGKKKRRLRCGRQQSSIDPSSSDESSSDGEATTPSKPKFRDKNHLPEVNQWITLWTLRHDLRQLYQDLMQATETEDFPRASKVRRLYRDATHLLQVGLSTFEQILQGRAPSTLQKVLAFVCVAKIMWTSVLSNKADSDQDHHDPLEGLPIWSSAIKDDEDRIVLSHISQILWGFLIPSGGGNGIDETPVVARNYAASLHSHQSAPTSSTSIDGHSLSPPDQQPYDDFFSPYSAQGSTSMFNGPAHDPMSTMIPVTTQPLIDPFELEVQRLLQETASLDDHRFADFLNLPGLQDVVASLPPLACDASSVPLCQVPYQVPLVPPGSESGLNGSVATFDIPQSPLTNCLFSDQDLDMQWHNVGWDPGNRLSGFSQDTPKPILNPDPDHNFSDLAPGLLVCLTGTFLFQVVLKSVKELKLLGPLLSILSGCAGLGCAAAKDGQGGPYSLRTGNSSLDIGTRVLKPLRQTFSQSFPQFLGLLAVAEVLMTAGFIRSLRDFEEYIIHAGSHFSRRQKSFLLLVKTVLSQCLACSSTMTWDNLYGDEDVATSDEYSSRYVAARMARERDLAKRYLEETPMTSEVETSPGLQERLGSDNTSSLSESPRITSTPNTPTSSSADTVAICTHSKCEKKYTGRDAHINLRRHIRCIHESAGKEWRCPGVGCSLKTKRRDNLRVHFLKKHPGETMPDWLLDTRRA